MRWRGDYAFSLSPQELFGSVVRVYKNDTLVSRGWFRWAFQLRRIIQTSLNDVETRSFILPVNFYNSIDVSGTDTTQWKIHKVPFPPSAHIMYISSMHLAHVSWPSIPIYPILLEAFNNGILIPSLRAGWSRRYLNVEKPLSLWISKRNCCCCQVLCFNYSKY